MLRAMLGAMLRAMLGAVVGVMVGVMVGVRVEPRVPYLGKHSLRACPQWPANSQAVDMDVARRVQSLSVFATKAALGDWGSQNKKCAPVLYDKVSTL